MVRTKSKVRVSPKTGARLLSLTGAKLLFFFRTHKHFLSFFNNLVEKCQNFGIYHITMIAKSPFLGIVSFSEKSYLCTQNQKELKIVRKAYQAKASDNRQLKSVRQNDSTIFVIR